MDGLGSTRLGRASSRYGGSTTVFNGPVRKWKKKWVHVSSPSSTNQNQSHSNGNGAAANLVLCRWTPLSPPDSGSAAPEEPPRRKFRYMPVAMLEEGGQGKIAAKQVDEEAKTSDMNESTNWLSSKNDILNMNSILKKENKDMKLGSLDLGLSLKGLVPERKNDEQQRTTINSSEFWKMA